MSPRLALMTTAAAPEVWAPILDRLLDEDPTGCITRIKWKPSRHGGRPWLTPAATVRQLEATRRNAARASLGSAGGSAPVQASIMLRGSLGYDPHAVAERLVGEIRRQTGLRLEEGPLDAAPRNGGWSMLPGFTTGTSGRLRLCLETQAALDDVCARFHGRALNVGSEVIAIEVANDLRDAPGNGRRRRGNRAPPSATAPPGQ